MCVLHKGDIVYANLPILSHKSPIHQRQIEPGKKTFSKISFTAHLSSRYYREDVAIPNPRTHHTRSCKSVIRLFLRSRWHHQFSIFLDLVKLNTPLSLFSSSVPLLWHIHTDSSSCQPDPLFFRHICARIVSLKQSSIRPLCS